MSEARNGDAIRCPICGREKEYEDIEYILEGIDHVTLVAGPCLMARGGHYTIQQVSKDKVPPQINADKRVPLRVEARNYHNNILTNEEFQEWIAVAKETGTLKQFPTRSLAEIQQPEIGLESPSTLQNPKLLQIVTHKAILPFYLALAPLLAFVGLISLFASSNLRGLLLIANVGAIASVVYAMIFIAREIKRT